jgi:hypothetical protein
MTFVGRLTLAVIMAPFFAAILGVSLVLALSISALLSMGLTVGIGIPDIEAQIALAIDVAAGIDLSVEVGVPSVTAQLNLALVAELALVEGFLAAVNALLEVEGASLDAYAYLGPGTALAGVLGELGGTGSTVALVFAAEGAGLVPPGQIASIQLLGGGQGYATGLCSVTFPASPTGSAATGTPVLVGGVLTGVTLTSPGSGYLLPPLPSVTDVAAVLGASNTNPIVIEIASTTGIGAVTISGVPGNLAANGMYVATVIDPTHFSIPVAGSGVYTSGGTVTGTGSGAACVPIMGGGAIAQLEGAFGGLTFTQGSLTSETITFGDLMPETFSLLVNLQAYLALQVGMLEQQILNFQVVPPTVAGNVEVLASILATLRANLDAPSIQLNLSAAVNDQASVAGQLMAGIQALITCSTEELDVYAYSGPEDGLAGAIANDVVLPSSACAVVILSATAPAAQAGLSVLFPGAEAA